MENSELDLLQCSRTVDESDPAVRDREGNGRGAWRTAGPNPDLLPKLARFELALMRFPGQNLGSRKFGVFADKCWPAFEQAFGFVPCYVNSRMAARACRSPARWTSTAR